MALKCQHVFCALCIETHIRTSSKGLTKANCPNCGMKGITKRSLVRADDIVGLMAKFDKLYFGLEKSMGVTLRDVRVQDAEVREAPGDTPNTNKPRLSTGQRPLGQTKITKFASSNRVDGKGEDGSKKAATTNSSKKPKAKTVTELVEEMPFDTSEHDESSPEIDATPEPKTSFSFKATSHKAPSKPIPFMMRGKFASNNGIVTENEAASSSQKGPETRIRKQISFLQLGRLTPYSERKGKADVEEFSQMLDKKRRHPSNESNCSSIQEPKIARIATDQEDSIQEPKNARITTDQDDFDSLIPNSQIHASTDLHQRSVIAGRCSPEPTDIFCSQESVPDQDEVMPTQIEESDDDLFASTPQKPSRLDMLRKGANTAAEPEKPTAEVCPQQRFGAPDVMSAQDRNDMILVCSGLNSQDRLAFNSLVKTYNLKVQNAVDNGVTHLVVNHDEEMRADRTLKFLQAVVKQKMIVGIKWIHECHSRGLLVKPDDYEVLDSHDEPGPHRSRSRGLRPKLFEGYEICLSGSFNLMRKEDLQILLTLEGAKMARTVHSMSFKLKGVIVTDDNMTEQTNSPDAERHFKSFKLVTVSKDWVLDSISGYFLHPVSSYLKHQVSPDELSKAGYSL